MKKLFAAILVVIMMISSPLTAFAGAETTLDFVNLDGNISVKNYNRMINNYCMIPLNVRENFQLSGWVITITDTRLEDTWYAGTSLSICAASALDLKEVRLEDSKNGTNAVIHEVGHFVDWKLKIASNEEWLRIYGEEGGNISSYASTSPSEGFTEAFELSFKDTKKFKKRCPQAYAYVISVCDTLEGVKE